MESCKVIDLATRRPTRSLLGFSRFVIHSAERTSSISCKICGARCRVKRGLTMRNGIASYYTGKAGLFDVFECPNIRLGWHASLTTRAKKISEEPDYSTIVTRMLTTTVDEYIKRELKEARPRHWLSRLWERLFGWHVRVFAYRSNIEELP